MTTYADEQRNKIGIGGGERCSACHEMVAQTKQLCSNCSAGVQSVSTYDGAMEQIWPLQKTLNKIQAEKALGRSKYEGTVEEKIDKLCTAIIHEAVELQRHTNWKWWKSPKPLDMSKAREELIDIWHFIIQASIELNMEPHDILQEYQKKHEINIKRQEENYGREWPEGY